MGALTPEVMARSLSQVLGFILAIALVLALLEGYVYLLFFRRPRSLLGAIFTRTVQGAMAAFLLLLVLRFLDRMGLIADLVAALGLAPLLAFPERAWAAWSAFSPMPWRLLLPFFLILALELLIYLTGEPRPSRLGLAYVLILPALIGISFLIVIPFLFEVRLAFSNMAMYTAQNPEFGLRYGVENFIKVFTGPVAKDATFFEVFGRTVLWTVINVFFHVTGGLILALLLNRPMRLRGLYRTILILPWAVPSTITAMAWRNEFDFRYGLFNILLRNAQQFFTDLAAQTQSLPLVYDLFAWLSQAVHPVPWRQDPTWAFISVVMTNVWLGIPFMMVVILGGLQSISQEYYEAAEIDGASKWQQFRHITLPLLRPVLVPATILGTVWTFNRFEVIYLVTQGGPQEKTDILVSSLYKAIFQFYRYGFSAAFALVIFFILLLWSIFYLRITKGLRGIYE
ncbi:Maltose transport system permease protein MalF [Candidatus Thermoflexus japonica]|uniref:Maltose transport system permease protein MalF n=1 Tax=Candidatus Thermoflexus japonica TaxID=2035417 RepID=A0A2H5Y461_9CHLR|nr:Maltose transport system permease protein MalF [Candidatus Thermoflexus japonica]